MSGATGTDEPTLIEKLDAVCNEIFERWDKDQRSGKLLSALAGRLPETYRKEVADIRRALAAYENKTDPYGANARLIAAAPDMLAALQRVLGLLIVDGEPSALARMEDCDESSVIKVYEIVSAAIAKATGETQ